MIGRTGTGRIRTRYLLHAERTLYPQGPFKAFAIIIVKDRDERDSNAWNGDVCFGRLIDACFMGNLLVGRLFAYRPKASLAGLFLRNLFYCCMWWGEVEGEGQGGGCWGWPLVKGWEGWGGKDKNSHTCKCIKQRPVKRMGCDSSESGFSREHNWWSVFVWGLSTRISLMQTFKTG